MKRSDYEKRVIFRLRRLLPQLDRDRAVRDPAGNPLRIQEPRRAFRWARGARIRQRKGQA